MNDDFVVYVLDQLRDVPNVHCKRMFSGHGLYRGETFFGIVADGVLYFKVDDETRGEYESRGSGPFRPTAKMTLKTYYEVPADVMEDREELSRWAERAAKSKESSDKKRPRRSAVTKRKKK